MENNFVQNEYGKKMWKFSQHALQWPEPISPHHIQKPDNSSSTETQSFMTYLQK